MQSDGWKCPGCGKCYAPWVPKCETCGAVLATPGGTWVLDPKKYEYSWCEHIWGEQTTMGVRCTNCGAIQDCPKPYTTCDTGDTSIICSICKTPMSDHISNCGGG